MIIMFPIANFTETHVILH